MVEGLEPRQLFSDTPTGFSPAVIRHAYGLDQVTFQATVKKTPRVVNGDGSGQTIAIVDAYRDPTIKQDLQTFDQAFGISDTDAKGRFALTIGTPQGRPAADSGWALEESLDVEWAHAIAPAAHILLVEARSSDTIDLLRAINWARRQPHVSAVSLSWGGSESPFETSFDQFLTTPGKHQGVTFVTASGDNGAPSSWPASSPNVVAVGGTTLRVNSQGNYLYETGWGGSGGGPSPYEGTYSPDVAINADPNTGYSVYDSTPDDQGNAGWQTVGGTSAGAPAWSAIFSIVNQGRALQHRRSLNGPTQTINALYAIPSSDYHDITVGDNGFPAGPGYDLVTGNGSPIANKLIPDLVSWTA